MGPSLVDEMECGNLFDQIDDLIKFPVEDECAGGGFLAGSVNSSEIPAIWNDAVDDSDGGLFAAAAAPHSDGLFADLSIPDEDVAQLEWLSSFVEDSFSTKGTAHHHFGTSSPVSVLESSTTSSSNSSNSSSVAKALPPPPPPTKPNHHHHHHRARSKRPRPTSFNPRPAVVQPAPPPPENHPPPAFASSSEEPQKNKKKKKEAAAAFVPPQETPETGLRKCLHCEITKTPQWRSGPSGPKTLCNACGVRFKSGRLFPEYRPAASPTFVPALHSNSHKKVIEMRTKSVK